MTDATEQQTSGENAQGFAIKDCALIAIATGRRASTLKELRDILLPVDAESIYYHFWGGLLHPRFEEREYNNDFAAWAWYELHDPVLAERLAVVDPTEFESLEDLRQELVETIEERLDEKEYLHWQFAASPFEFIRSQIVVFDTRKRAATPEDLAVLLPDVSASSFFYHFIDARRRLEHHGDDFSFWLSSWGSRYQDLCASLAAIDPYFGSLPQLKAKLVAIFQEHLAKEVAHDQSA